MKFIISKKEGKKMKILAVGDIVGSTGINELKLRLKESAPCPHFCKHS